VTGLGVTTDGTLVVVSAGQLLERRDGGWLRRDPADPDGLLSSAAAALGPGVASYRPRDHTLVRLAPDRRAERIGGNGTTGRFGDGGPANGASFTCHDIVVAASGQILFSDPFNQRVARMQTNGIIETFAGLADDGRVAGGIALAPMGVTLDANQALHIADFGHHRIVKVTSDGASTVVAGNGAAGFAGDGAPAIDAALDSPFDVAVAVSGELFITDSGNRRVRRVDMQGIISTLVALDFEPGSLAIQPNGDLLVMERTGSALVEIRLQDGPSVTPLDGGAGGADVIPGHRIDAIAIAGTDSLLVAANGDLWNVALPLAASPAGGFTAIGSLKPSRTVSAMTMDAAGNLLVCDAAHRRILRISAASLNEARAPFMAGSGASL
jgi:sugar lactone lactonase YvrE